MDKNPQIYKQHILDAIKIIEGYIADSTKEAFLKNQMMQDAVVRQLEIIGEAARRLPQSIKSQAEEMPWTEISAMRNKIVHDYIDVNLDIVWDTIQQDLPILKDGLSKA